MSLETATAEIRKKRTSLIAAGLEVGEPRGKVEDAGSGGFVQAFSGGVRIYWHRATGAHEVHGPVLTKYLALGGPGKNPRTGRRDFGFPRTDESKTPFGTVVSSFEFGHVYSVPSFEAVGVYGPLGKRLATGQDGLPICEPTRTATGEVMFCERCCYFQPAGSEAILRSGVGVSLPQLGRPWMLSTDAGQTLFRPAFTIPRAVWDELLADESGSNAQRRERVLAKLAAVWKDKLVLRSVRNKASKRELVVSVGEVKDEPNSRDVLVSMVVQQKLTTPIPERVLYDVCVRLPDNRVHAVAPHSVYARSRWNNFGYLHATDLHVSRRLETFRKHLKEAGRSRSARLMVNTNDSVRALFNYANELHNQGMIDFMLLTGDLVDYIFEEGQDRTGGGNFRHFERLVLGEASPLDPEGDPNEELHVPLFTVLGNHDYVPNPYPLWFEIEIEGKRNPIIRKFGSFNLESGDAMALQGGKKPVVSTDEGAGMASSDRKPNDHYRRRINRDLTYLIQLGDHRIVMLDTGANADVLSGIADAIEEYFGRSNENERTFVKGTPNSKGTDLSVLIAGIKDASEAGTLVVGMHNPPLNVERNEYSHFLRETEHSELDKDDLENLIEDFMLRGGGADSTWKLGNTKHFKRGSIAAGLDFGVATWPEGLAVTLLGLVSDTKVDAVLCGHVHERVEFRIEREGSTGFRYFTDFYTENPPSHRESFDYGQVMGAVIGDDRPIFITVDPKARVGEKIVLSRDNRPEKPVESRTLRVPPYATPLDQADDKPAWWRHHRPLIIQTPCVGPIDHTQRVAPGERARRSFQGIRAIRVQNDVISRISFVSIGDIRAKTRPAGFFAKPRPGSKPLEPKPLPARP